MAIDLTLKGTGITNRNATPRVLNNPGSGGAGRMYVRYGYLASVTASLSITSVIRLVQIPSNAVVRALYFQSAAQGAGKFDIGAWRSNVGGLAGVVADQDYFASAVDCASAVVRTDILNESTTHTIARQNTMVWESVEATPLTADPQCWYDLAATVVTTDVTTGTGAIALEVWYTI